MASELLPTMTMLPGSFRAERTNGMQMATANTIIETMIAVVEYPRPTNPKSDKPRLLSLIVGDLVQDP